jgi:3-hydroxyisobutyrate dehydrogenase-like beta-hydroxyacid dehydrogenase
MGTVAILGAGKMGEALMSGQLRAGRAPADVVFTERHPERTALLEERYGVSGVGTAAAAGLVLYFVCALYTHIRVRDHSPTFALAAVFLALAITTLALDPAR